MTPERLEFEQFLSYRQRQVLLLRDQGLILVRGENRISAAADSNGAGKTAIGDALAFGLFGQTLRGLKGDDVACRFTTESLEVVVSCDTAEIRRRRRPKALIITPRTGSELSGDDQEKQAWIDDQLGYGFQTFKNAIVFGQGPFERFALADQHAQLKMLDEIQGLDFRIALARAKAWHARITSEQAVVLAQFMKLRERVLELSEQERALIKAGREYDRRRQAELDEMRRTLDGLRGKLLSQQRRLRELLAIRATLPQRRQIAARIRQQQSTQAALSEARATLTGQVTQLVAQLEQLDASVKALVEQGRCPTCRQPTDASTADAFSDDRERISTAYRAVLKEQAHLDTQLNTLGRTLTAGQVRLPDELVVLEHECGDANLDRERTLEATSKADLDAAMEHRQLRMVQVWPDQDLLTSVWERRAKAGAELDRLDRRLGVLEMDGACAAYWVDAFGDRGIRALLFDHVAAYVNERLAWHLGYLAAGEVQADLATQLPTKAGTVRERINLHATWTWGGDGRGTGSGGQDRRVDLALFAALQDLAERRAGRLLPVKIYDEPADQLDPRGLELFTEWIRAQARERGTILLITHNPALGETIEPDQIWTVVFDGSGSRVIVDGGGV